jgi:hypothetical protein
MYKERRNVAVRSKDLQLRWVITWAQAEAYATCDDSFAATISGSN